MLIRSTVHMFICTPTLTNHLLKHIFATSGMFSSPRTPLKILNCGGGAGWRVGGMEGPGISNILNAKTRRIHLAFISRTPVLMGRGGTTQKQDPPGSTQDPPRIHPRIHPEKQALVAQNVVISLNVDVASVVVHFWCGDISWIIKTAVQSKE